MAGLTPPGGTAPHPSMGAMPPGGTAPHPSVAGGARPSPLGPGVTVDSAWFIDAEKSAELVKLVFGLMLVRVSNFLFRFDCELQFRVLFTVLLSRESMSMSRL